MNQINGRFQGKRLMRIKQLENRLTRKGLLYSDEILGPMTSISEYMSQCCGITFTTRKQAYKRPSFFSQFKFRSLEQFLKNAKIIHSETLSYYNPKKGGVKQLGIQWGKRNWWKLHHLKSALTLIKNAEIGIEKSTPRSLLVIQNDDYVAMIMPTNPDLYDDEEEMLQLQYENNLIPFEEVTMTQYQIRRFLEHLAGEEGCQYNGIKWRCGGKEFTYSKKVLNTMNISKEDQEKFLEICKEFGGYCDCEILMNAAPILLDEDDL